MLDGADGVNTYGSYSDEANAFVPVTYNFNQNRNQSSTSIDAKATDETEVGKRKNFQFVEDSYQSTQAVNPLLHPRVPSQTVELLQQFKRNNLPLFPSQEPCYYQSLKSLVPHDGKPGLLPAEFGIKNGVLDKVTYEKHYSLLQSQILDMQAVLNIHERQYQKNPIESLKMLADGDFEELNKLRNKLHKLKREYDRIRLDALADEIIENHLALLPKVPISPESHPQTYSRFTEYSEETVSDMDEKQLSNNSKGKRKRML